MPTQNTHEKIIKDKARKTNESPTCGVPQPQVNDAAVYRHICTEIVEDGRNVVLRRGSNVIGTVQVVIIRLPFADEVGFGGWEGNGIFERETRGRYPLGLTDRKKECAHQRLEGCSGMKTVEKPCDQRVQKGGKRTDEREQG